MSASSLSKPNSFFPRIRQAFWRLVDHQDSLSTVERMQDSMQISSSFINGLGCASKKEAWEILKKGKRNIEESIQLISHPQQWIEEKKKTAEQGLQIYHHIKENPSQSINTFVHQSIDQVDHKIENLLDPNPQMRGKAWGELAFSTGKLVASKTWDAPQTSSTLKMLESSLQVEKKVSQESIRLSFDGLKKVWRSEAGVEYGLDRRLGNGIQHVLSHASEDSKKKIHTVFSIPRNEILKTVDEAWKIKGDVLKNDPYVYVVDLKRIIGTSGETKIRLVVDRNTYFLKTAYPWKE
ncbi:MAG: hypothetical protein JNK65_00870 [Deltaproteobacteria bacterium]|nr:hypothetical protein [Deltaproteobacteria bacterium]